MGDPVNPEGAGGHRVLVPVANPASVAPLLRCAALLAAGDGGHVQLVTILPTHAEEEDHQRARAGLATIEGSAAELAVPCSGEVRTAHDITTGVLDAVAELDATLVLMGWRGGSSTTDVFGRLIDRVVGRSTVPLAIARLGTEPFRRVLLPISDDHLLPGGGGGLALATDLVERLRTGSQEPTTPLRTGRREHPLPPEVARLGDRVHHDPRKTHQAVGAFARAEDAVVAAVAPTVSGLRAATTHLAWAAPRSTLIVAVDVGPQRDGDLAGAVEAAGRPPPRPVRPHGTFEVRINVTVRLPDDTQLPTAAVSAVLARAGEVTDLMAWWPAGDPRPHLSATVTVYAATSNDAIASIMTQLHEAAELRGAEISYELDRTSGWRVAVGTEATHGRDDGGQRGDGILMRRGAGRIRPS
ncbi:MAG: universal stress protein [Nitriliruptoraceae bacterium]